MSPRLLGLFVAGKIGASWSIGKAGREIAAHSKPFLNRHTTLLAKRFYRGQWNSSKPSQVCVVALNIRLYDVYGARWGLNIVDSVGADVLNSFF